jgi:diguanylate cyclase (GGDEF)-like protein
MNLLSTKSLAANITLVVLLASSVSLGVFAAAMLLFDRSSAIAESDARLATLADIVGQNSMAALDFDDRDAAGKILQALRKEPPIVSACLYSNISGHLFSAYYREPSATSCPQTEPLNSKSPRNLRSVSRPILRSSETVGSIYLLADMHSLQSRRNKLILLLLVMALLSLGAGGVTGLIMQKRISKPISLLARGMHHVTSEATFDARAELKGSTEIVELAREFNSMVTELARRDRLAKQAKLLLHQQACTDALTGLPNRRLFTDCLARATAFAQREKNIFGLLYIDLDGFKLVNDSLGHSIGDTLLCEVASRFKQHVRRADVLSRVGGDEFTVILTSVHEPADAGRVAELLLECLAKPFQVGGHEITVGASIGISTLEIDSAADVDLLQQADSAMYAAKRSGRNRAVFFTQDLGLMARERLLVENELRGAIERGEIYVHYQPEFNVLTGDIVRFEALARWRHPTLGQIAPDRFIPVAEETGLIFPIGSFVLERACTEAIKWQRPGRRPIQVAVNMSAIQFNSDRILEEIATILDRTGMSPQLLQIELTESVMVGSIQRSSEMMHKMRELGLSIAIDDFGIGYSCLGYLPNLPIDVIKIDQSFTNKLCEGSDTVKMVRSMIDLAHSMEMRVIVEGVEEQAQLNLICDMGADEVQGFLLGPPGAEPSTRSDLEPGDLTSNYGYEAFASHKFLLAEQS